MNLIDRPAGTVDDWFSFVTVTPDKSDNWSRTVVVNLTPDGSLVFPQKNGSGSMFLLTLAQKNGSAKIWQNGTLISHAKVEGGYGYLAQAHFGLYASAAIPAGIIYNDKIRIIEVSNESQALSLVDSTW